MENKHIWEEVEKRFDERFNNFNGLTRKGFFIDISDDIKSFIRQEIDLAVKRREGELREEYKKMVGRKSVYLLGKSKEYAEGYKAGYKNNEADTLTLLTHKEI